MKTTHLRQARTELIDPRTGIGHELTQALQPLRADLPLTDESVHQIRKQLKRARAGLRLLRDTVGKSAYVKANRLLRDAGRPLSAVRDTRAMLDKVAALLASKAGKRHGAALRELRSRLRKQRAELLAELQSQGGIAKAAQPLEEARELTSPWRVPRDLWPVLQAGIRRIYRKGRRALALAESNTTARALHESRKQVKYLGAALGMLGRARARRAAKLVKRANAIAKPLGNDHDLAVLRSMVSAMRADPVLLEKLDRRRRKLQKKALKRGRKLYKRKPGKFVMRLQRAKVPREAAA
jgi:CHAD domain-containing protein